MMQDMKFSEFSSSFFDDELGADVMDLDNSTYFNTVAELSLAKMPSDW